MVMLILGGLLLVVGGVLDSVLRFRMFRIGQNGRFFKADHLTTAAITKCARNTAGQLGRST
jgi:hypothetical protein